MLQYKYVQTIKKRADNQIKLSFSLLNLFINMSIISQQICRVNKQKLAEGFFTKLLLTTLNSNIYISIYFALQREQEGKGGKTTYKNSQAVLNQIGKSDRHYRSGMSVFKKLGFFLKHDGYPYLNPLLDNINTKKPYEDVISFYNLLWDEPLKASIQFPGDINGLHTLEQIRSMWIEQSLKTLPNYTYDDLYDLVFNSSDSEIILSQTEKILGMMSFQNIEILVLISKNS